MKYCIKKKERKKKRKREKKEKRQVYSMLLITCCLNEKGGHERFSLHRSERQLETSVYNK